MKVLLLLTTPGSVLVHVPGIQQGQFGAKQTIEPLDWVEERWISRGAAVIYLEQIGAVRLILLGAVIAVCLGYLVVAFSALATAQRKEVDSAEAEGGTTREYKHDICAHAISKLTSALLLLTF